jgi:hypothetical protein
MVSKRLPASQSDELELALSRGRAITGPDRCGWVRRSVDELIDFLAGDLVEWVQRDRQVLVHGNLSRCSTQVAVALDGIHSLADECGLGALDHRNRRRSKIWSPKVLDNQRQNLLGFAFTFRHARERRGGRNHRRGGEMAKPVKFIGVDLTENAPFCLKGERGCWNKIPALSAPPDQTTPVLELLNVYRRYRPTDRYPET